MIFDPLLSIILSLIKNICQAKNTLSPKVLSFDTIIIKKKKVKTYKSPFLSYWFNYIFNA